MRSGAVQPSMPPAMVVGQPVSACQSSRINAAAGVAAPGLGGLDCCEDLHRSFRGNPVAGDHGEAPKAMAAL